LIHSHGDLLAAPFQSLAYFVTPRFTPHKNHSHPFCHPGPDPGPSDFDWNRETSRPLGPGLLNRAAVPRARWVAKQRCHQVQHRLSLSRHPGRRRRGCRGGTVLVSI